MKNIVFVIESLHLGGAEKCLLSLLQNIDYSRYKVDLILFKKDGLFEKFLPKEVQIIRKNFPSFSFLDRVRFKLMRILYKNKYHSAQLLWKIIADRFVQDSNQYDCAIAYNQGFATYYTSKYISAGKKYSWLNINYQKAGYNLDFDFSIYEKFEKVIAVSPEVKSILDKVLEKSNKYLTTEVILDIVDKDLIVKQSFEEAEHKFDLECTNIVTVGRLAKQKGLHLAIRSCKKILDKGYKIKWYVVGEGSERVFLEKLVKQNNLQDDFILLGATDNPYPYIKEATIFVQTSLFEGLGTTVIEASLLNKPIVCTNFPSVYGILKDKETGLIAEMNSDSITEKIELLIQDAYLKNKLVHNLGLQENKNKETTLEQFYANI